ncbi:MAG: hypothetical protein IKW77_07935 [Salinivirgaceae bacterium]|nr:hypothetical protein [Salinivirgaceae bacterium]
MEQQSTKALNKDCNNYYIKVAILFSILSCLAPIVLYIVSYRVYDEILDALILIYLIQSGLYLAFYGLGRWFDFDISPLIFLISFGDFIFVFFGLCLMSLVVSMGPVDFFGIFRHVSIDIYFILLFLSKFLLIFILDRKQNQLREQYRKID